MELIILLMLTHLLWVDRNTYRLRQRFPECSTYYDRWQNVLYHNNHIYFIGKYFYHGSPAFCKVNTTTGVTTRIINIGNRFTNLGLQKHNDIIFVVSNDKEFLFMIHQPIDVNVCSTSGTLNRCY